MKAQTLSWLARQKKQLAMPRCLASAWPLEVKRLLWLRAPPKLALALAMIIPKPRADTLMPFGQPCP